MPIKPKYAKIKAEMIAKYGEDKGEKIFSAWVNKENIIPDLKAFYFTSEQLKSLDDDYVEGAIATGDPDAYYDILTERCLKDMEAQLKSLPITIDDNHESFKNVSEDEKFRSINPLAKVTSAVLDGVKLNVKCVLNKAHSRYEEIKSSIKNGFLHSFSFAFIPVEAKSIEINGVIHRVIDKVRLLNGCFTGIPVNPEASFSRVMVKSLRELEYNELEVNEIIRGVEMTNEEVKVEETPKVDEVVEESVTEPVEEVKSISGRLEAIELQLAEKKSLEIKAKAVEEKTGEVKVEEKSKIDVLEQQIAELKALIAKPQMKARVEKEIVDEEPLVKSRGPLDMIG